MNYPNVPNNTRSILIGIVVAILLSCVACIALYTAATF